MVNYSPKLPLTRGSETSYEMLKTMSEVIKQNFRMLVLTNPGERMMIPDFGVGLYRFFFEPLSAVLFDKVRTRITSQVSKYMPFLNVRNIDFITSEQDDSLNPNTLYVKIRYTIPAINANDEIQLTVNNYEF
jgi:phage baseplate assembly protein W